MIDKCPEPEPEGTFFRPIKVRTGHFMTMCIKLYYYLS